jgi:SNF2-related domain
MILSLIAATKNQISAPEESIVDDRPVMTPLSFRHFPSAEFDTSRKKFFRGNHQRNEISQVPSLVELMLHRSRTAPYCDITKSYSSSLYRRLTKSDDEVNTLPLGEMLCENVPFYHHYLEDPSIRERSPRNRCDQGPKVMYLTSATLIIVPANLLSQWDREIMKHCSTPLRVLMLRTKTQVPNVKSLATDFDVG